MRVANTVLTVAILLATAACNSNESIAAFTKNAAELSNLLPGIAEIPYNACVDQRTMQQIAGSDGLPDHEAASGQCQRQAQLRERMAKQYGILALYMDSLAKLATGSATTPISAKSIAGSAATLDGSSTAQQSAVSGLAGVIAGAYLHGRSAKALREAITAADPHIQVLCKAFGSEIAPGIMVGLQAEEQQLKMLYNDSQSSGAVRVLLLRQFETDQRQIAHNRALLKNYTSALDKLAAAHSKLFANRTRLKSRDTLNQLAVDSNAIAADLKAAYQ